MRKVALSACVAAFLGFLVSAGANHSTGSTLTHHLANFSVVEEANAKAPVPVPQETAQQNALQILSGLDATVTGFRVQDAYHAAALLKVSDVTGRILHTSSTPEDAWVFKYTAPRQKHYLHVTALVVVDAPTGRVLDAQLLQTN